MSRNTFVFGIGGTGARIIKALTMLLASGVRLNDTNKVIPIIIDVDAKNGDTTRTLQALQLYKEIREKGYGNRGKLESGFFNTDLNTLNSLKTELGKHDKLNDSFQLQFDNLETSFISYVDPKQELVGDINMDMLEALYDNTPAGHPDFHNTELNLRLDLGFKGNPNIGCVVFNNLAKLREFKFILNNIGEDDRVFIVSSIFGGTGSSGFPQLVKLLQEEPKVAAIPFGALTVMPYFNVSDKKKKSAIDSNRFNAKTEAALAYYSKNLAGKLNCFYHLSDKPLKQYENVEGGLEQKNNAHLVEFIGATAIIDFINKPETSFKNKSQTEYFDFGIREENSVVDISHFFDKTQKSVLEPLTLLTYASKIYLEAMPELSDEAFYKELNLASDDPFYKHLSTFFNVHYKRWLEEMMDNERQFQPFNIKEDLNSLVRGRQIKVSKILGMKMDGGISTRFLKEKLGKAEDKLKNEITEKDKRLLRLLNVISDECMAKLKTATTA